MKSLVEYIIALLYYFIDENEELQEIKRNVTKDDARKWFSGIINDRHVNWLSLMERLALQGEELKKFAEEMGFNEGQAMELNDLIIEGLCKAKIIVSRKNFSGTAYHVHIVGSHALTPCSYNGEEFLLSSIKDAAVFACACTVFYNETEIRIEEIKIIEFNERQNKKEPYGEDWINVMAGQWTNIFIKNLLYCKEIAGKIEEILRSFGISEKYKGGNEIQHEYLLLDPYAFLNNILYNEGFLVGLEYRELFSLQVPAEIKQKIDSLLENNGKYPLISRKGNNLEEKTVNVFVIAQELEKVLYENGLKNKTPPARKPKNRYQSDRSTIVLVLYMIDGHNAQAKISAASYKEMSDEDSLELLKILELF